jgi:hypothetical protein
VLGLGIAVGPGCGDPAPPPGTIEGGARPVSVVEATDAARSDADLALRRGDAGVGRDRKQILFGDLHVHTTYSIDAFVYALPILGGEGAHPPADACDFARHCAALDFFSLNDHAEGLTPERWRRTRESLRQCNARAGDPEDPDLVAFAGWEWTQVGATPETHYGHRNVIFPGLADDELPARPITSLPDGITRRMAASWLLRGLQGIGAFGLDAYADLLAWFERMIAIPDCERGVDTRDLPPDCRENAATPAELFEKLAQWGFDTLVIPHGLAWGVHAPPGARMDNQLAGGQHDPQRQRLLEIFSGHGNGETYRPLPEYALDERGERICPEPTPDFLPCCWRAGEIMRDRCGDLPPAECEARVAEARRLALEAGSDAHRVFPDSRPEDWLDCDQCRDCFKPVMTPRPGETAQYAAAIGDFDRTDASGRPRRFRYGFIASSDNHTARPGGGYKQVHRRGMADISGFRSERVEWLLRPWVQGRQQDPRRPQPVPRAARGLRDLFDSERVSSFMYTGGLVAVHARGRSRRAIWDALVRREVYGTSGPRILLWFDLRNGPDGPAPMGSAVAMREVPRFEARAVGAFRQRPGCPASSTRSLSAERLDRLCWGECYNPSDVRHPIAAIEVVRIRPQREPGEDPATLVEDPWLRFPCEPDPAGCVVRFEDPEFPASGRDAVYYVRAIQPETPAINGAQLRVAFDAAGRAVAVTPCYGSYRTDASDDCLAPAAERAWSSPIYVDRPAGRPSPGPGERGE